MLVSIPYPLICILLFFEIRKEDHQVPIVAPIKIAEPVAPRKPTFVPRNAYMTIKIMARVIQILPNHISSLDKVKIDLPIKNTTNPEIIRIAK